MNDQPLVYIAIPAQAHRPERIDAVLEKRMKDFLLARRRKVWQEEAR